MTSKQEPPRPKGLSLYANLLDNDKSGTISGAPVSYANPDPGSDQDEAAKKQQALAASIRFQPTKRPQLAAPKAKAKAIASKLSGLPLTIPQPPAEPKIDSQPDPPPQPTLKTSAADWIATVSEDEDANAYYSSTKQRRKKRKKKNNNNKKEERVEVTQDWDNIYDPSRPNNYEEYKHSEEKIREVREWKDLLYRHRMQNRRHSSEESDRSTDRSMNRTLAIFNKATPLTSPGRFAPPPISFAPPPDFNNSPPPPPPTTIPDDPTGDDAYQRRLRMSQSLAPPPPLPQPTGQISRAPVTYDTPPPPPDHNTSHQDPAPPQTNPSSTSDPGIRSTRPGQKNFAERLLTKYGWTKGSGLGAQGTGIINPLYAKADKRKKKSDAEGGGFATPANTGKILGGHKSAAAQKLEDAEREGIFGIMSEVVRVEGMLDGVDVLTEFARTDDNMNVDGDGGGGGLMQKIGTEGEKYGAVQRVFIHVPDNEDGEAVVFICFVSQLSALRAVNSLDGKVFGIGAGSGVMRARYWDKEKFEDGVYV